MGTKQTYTGRQIVGLWSNALGKELVTSFTTKESLAGWEGQMRNIVPGEYGKALARNLRILQEAIMGMDLVISDQEYADPVEVLGREPVNYEQWVRETAGKWLEAH